MPKLLFLYNPCAGKGSIKNKISDVVDIFVKAGYDVTIYPTQCEEDGKRKILADGKKYKRIVCCGGDGTLNEVVSGMMETGLTMPLGYIPLGSTNDFGNSLGIPKQAIRAARAAVGERHYHSDVGRFNDRWFVYVAAFGLFTDVSYQTKQELKNVFGHSAYVLEAMKRLYNVPCYPMTICYDDEQISGEYIYGMVSNSESVGGFKNLTGKEVHLDDGLYEVVMIRQPANALQFQEMLMSVLSGQLKAANIDTFKASKLTITSEVSVPWTLDGEFGGEHKQVSIVNHMQALDILIS
ncbi:MAG: diacylglycerol/lipid kinase family protein [Lachnospiraceae bacterium]